MRLIVPTLEATLLECIPAQTPISLAFEHVCMDVIKIPTCVSFFREGLEDLLHTWINAGCEIMKLLRVFKEIEQLGWIHGAGDKLPGSTADHHEWGDCALARILSVDTVIVVRCTRALQVRDKRIAIDGEALVQRPID